MLFENKNFVMRTGKKLIKILAIASGAALVRYLVGHYQNELRDARVADEGYETAYDILFPEKKDGHKKKQYGPVIPGQLMS
jgi:hypothetical protein